MELLPKLCAFLLICSLCAGPVLSTMFGGGCFSFRCNKSCPSGYKRDFRGCKLCQCKFVSQNAGTNTGVGTGNFAQANYRPVILIPIKCKKLTCTTTCSNGRQRNNKGCETCTCKTILGNTGMMGNMGMMGNTGNMGMMGNTGMMGNMGNMGFNSGFNTGSKKKFNSGFNTGFNQFNSGFNTGGFNTGGFNTGFQSVPCPFGIRKVNCPISPCLQAKCSNRFATCVESYCGGCHAAFYMNKKRIFC